MVCDDLPPFDAVTAAGRPSLPVVPSSRLSPVDSLDSWKSPANRRVVLWPDGNTHRYHCRQQVLVNATRNAPSQTGRHPLLSTETFQTSHHNGISPQLFARRLGRTTSLVTFIRFHLQSSRQWKPQAIKSHVWVAIPRAGAGPLHAAADACTSLPPKRRLRRSPRPEFIPPALSRGKTHTCPPTFPCRQVSRRQV